MKATFEMKDKDGNHYLVSPEWFVGDVNEGFVYRLKDNTVGEAVAVTFDFVKACEVVRVREYSVTISSKNGVGVRIV